MSARRPHVTLTIDSLAAGGDGVGRDDTGRVTFVSRAAPGDRVRVALVETKKRFARGVVDAILEPADCRVKPPCPYFEAASCGGCQWLHVSAEAQAKAKRDIVASALRRFVDQGLAIEELVSPGPALGWRRRARWHWVRRKRGQVVLGFFAWRSQRVVDVETCPQLEPALQDALAVLRGDLTPGLSGRGTVSAVAGQGGDVHIDIEGPCRPDAAEALVGRGPIAGVSLGKRRFGAESVALDAGARAAAGDFAQASAGGNRALLDAVDDLSAPRSGLRILELYAGSGNITRILRRGAREVVACELELPQHRTTGERSEGDAPVVWSVGDAAEKVEELEAYDEAFDLVVLDPPRTGAAAVMPGIAALRPDRALYVSCDPATLARDLDILCSAGYRAVRARPIDLMPQTAHVEVVVAVERDA